MNDRATLLFMFPHLNERWVSDPARDGNTPELQLPFLPRLNLTELMLPSMPHTTSARLPGRRGALLPSDMTDYQTRARTERAKLKMRKPCGPEISFGKERRFAEAVSLRDQRLAPGPGAYAVTTSGMGLQKDSMHRTMRATFIGPCASPTALPDDSARRANLAEIACYKLRKKLKYGRAALERMFAQWDSNRDGTVDQREFHNGLLSMGVLVSESDLDHIFNTFDTDHSGAVSIIELRTFLWERKDAVAEAEYGESWELSKQQHGSRLKLRRGKLDAAGSRTYVALSVADRDKPLQEQIRLDLTRNAGR